MLIFMEVAICSVPVEAPGAKLTRKRSEGQDPQMPKGAISSLNNWAEKNSFKTCKFYDIDMLYPSDDEVESFFRENKSDVVGLSAVVSTSYLQVKRLARIIKKVNKNTLVVCGGYLTSASNVVLKKTQVDVCVVGNGEIAWVGILKFMKEHLKTGKNKIDVDELLKVKGIAILDDEKNLKFSGYGQTLSSCNMTFPSFEYLQSGLFGDEEALQSYFKPFHGCEVFLMDERSFEKNRKPMMMSIFTSKGCVAKCTFCQRGSKGYTTYDLSKLEAHLKNVRDNYDVGFLMVSDENFGSNRKYSYQVAELFNKYNMLWWASGVRCTSVTKEDLIHYKKNGCSALKFGIETGSQTMLDIMEKKFTVEDIKKALFMCYDIGLYTQPIGYMVGMPGENLRTSMESGKMMGEIAAKLKIPVGLIFAHSDIMYAIPMCGTPLFEYGKQLGLVGKSVDDEEKFLIQTSDSAPHKRYFINFNGAPMSEVVFWDMLVFLEATRTYVKLMKNKNEDENWKKKFAIALKIQGLNPNVRAKQRKVKVIGGAGIVDDISVSQYFITNFLKQHVIFNKFIAKLPRFIVYPIVRYMLYFEFLLQKNVFKDKNNLHTTSKEIFKSKVRIMESEVNPQLTTQKDRSLRSIVERKMKQLKQTAQDKIHSSLTAGP